MGEAKLRREAQRNGLWTLEWVGGMTCCWVIRDRFDELVTTLDCDEEIARSIVDEHNARIEEMSGVERPGDE